jgi:competence protein ComEC
MVPQILAFCAGAAGALALPALPSSGPLWSMAACGLLLLRRAPAVAALSLGFAWTSFGASQALQGDWPCARDRDLTEIVGRVAGPALVRSGRTDFDLDVIGPGMPTALPARARVSWYEPTATPRPGQSWRLPLRLRCRNGMANPGAPDRELDLLRQHIGATGYTVADAPPEMLDDGREAAGLERQRARIADSIDELLSGSASGAILQGLSVGVRGDIPDRLWDALAATGLAHLMAISGLHVTGCAVFVLILLRAAWRLRLLSAFPHRVAAEAVIVLIVTAAYVGLSGASLPAMRTLAMVAIFATSRGFRRSQTLPQLLASAALLLVALDPLALTSAGFWLSFAATAGLCSLFTSGRGWRARVVAFMQAQLALLALLTPVLAAAFGRVSLIAPVANAVAIPLFTALLLPAVLFGTALEWLMPGAGGPVWRLLAATLDPLWPGLIAIGEWRFASWAPAAQPLLWNAIAGVVTLAALCLPLRGLRYAAAAVLTAVVCGAAASSVRGAWTLTVLDVGQGLAAVVETHRHVLVFDTGPSWRGGVAAARVSLLPYLRSRGIRRVDRLVISHADQDHAGGAALLMASIDVVSSMAGGSAEPSLAAEACRRGTRWQWDGVLFEVLHPSAGTAGDDNDLSCALRMSGAGGSALLLADPEAAAEQELRTLPLASDVVLLPHHGSSTSSSPEIVSAVSARLGIVSVGFGNH